MADVDVLPYDYPAYAKEIVSYVDGAKRKAADEKLSGVDLTPVLAAAQRFADAVAPQVIPWNEMLRAASHVLAAEPGATVACVAVEICSAAFYLDDDPGVIISACLFSDGAAASIWRSVFVSPGNQRAGSRGSRGTSDAGSMDSGWDRNADDMASLSSKMALIAVGMGGGAAAATAGSGASKLTGPETVYVAMDSAGRGGMTSAAQANSPGELNMKIVAAIPPTPPPLADMAAAKIAAIIRPTRPIGMWVVMKVGNT